MRQTDKTIEAMKQALERVDRAIDEPNITMSDGKALKEIFRQLHLIKDAIHAAIAEAAMQRLTEVQQEMEPTAEKSSEVQPVAWMLNGKFYTAKELSSFTLTTKEKLNRIPFYSHPPRREWVGLTDEEIFKCVALEKLDALRYLETKLKEKNGG